MQEADEKALDFFDGGLCHKGRLCKMCIRDSSLCELIVGGKDGLQPVQKTIIDRCVRLVYQTYLNDPRPENMPILEDLYNLLRSQEEKEAQYIATALEIYVTGSLNVFNHQSNAKQNA